MQIFKLVAAATFLFLTACAPALTELPDRDVDFIQVGWGGSITGPAANSTRRVYSDDIVYFFEEGWEEDFLVSTTIEGAYAEAQGILNMNGGATHAQLADAPSERECAVLDYGLDVIGTSISGEITHIVNYCPVYESDTGSFSEAFHNIYQPLNVLLDIDPR